MYNELNPEARPLQGNGYYARHAKATWIQISRRCYSNSKHIHRLFQQPTGSSSMARQKGFIQNIGIILPKIGIIFYLNAGVVELVLSILHLVVKTKVVVTSCTLRLSLWGCLLWWHNIHLRIISLGDVLNAKQRQPIQNIVNTVTNYIGDFIENPLSLGFIQMKTHLLSQSCQRQVKLVVFILFL